MYKRLLLLSLGLFIMISSTAIKGDKAAGRFSGNLNSGDIMKVMSSVADWQIDNFASVPHHQLDWTNGTLYGGMMEFAKISPDRKYMDWLYRIGRSHAWQPHRNMYHADDIAVCQMYLEMYRQKKTDRGSYLIIAPTQARLDYVISHPSSFFCYAIAYGINSGLLDKEIYTPVVIKAWKALVSAVHADGKLGWVQPVGQDPKDVTSDMTEVYGVGAFLLAGTEMMMLSQNKN